MVPAETRQWDRGRSFYDYVTARCSRIARRRPSSRRRCRTPSRLRHRASTCSHCCMQSDCRDRHRPWACRYTSRSSCSRPLARKAAPTGASSKPEEYRCTDLVTRRSQPRARTARRSSCCRPVACPRSSARCRARLQRLQRPKRRRRVHRPCCQVPLRPAFRPRSRRRPRQARPQRQACRHCFGRQPMSARHQHRCQPSPRFRRCSRHRPCCYRRSSYQPSSSARRLRPRWRCRHYHRIRHLRRSRRPKPSNQLPKTPLQIESLPSCLDSGDRARTFMGRRSNKSSNARAPTSARLEVGATVADVDVFRPFRFELVAGGALNFECRR